MGSMPPYAANLMQRGVTGALNRSTPQGGLMAPSFGAASNFSGAIMDYLRQLLAQRTGAAAPGGGPTPPPTLPSPTPDVPERVGVSTKMEPDAPIKFAWGAGKPQAYTPGISDVLSMSGAPPTREGLMGQAPVAGGTQSGGYGESQPWANVANPGGFPSFWEQLQEQEAMRGAQDPLWKERQLAGIEAGGQVAAARGIGEAQLELMRRQREMAQQDIQAEVESKIRQYQQTFGKPPSPEEVQRIVDNAQADYAMQSPFKKG